jgi:phospholipid/cholesterol/gamma-HCH transport system substrate-binding protein
METARGSAARVGFVIFVAMLLVIGAFYLVGDGGGIFRDYKRYRLLFPTTTGLRKGALVEISGVPAGRVEDISFPKDPNQRKILVTITVQSRVADRIRKDSFAWIQTQGLLGDKEVAVLAGDPVFPALPPDSVIETKQRSFVQEFVGPELVSGTADLLENMVSVLKEINSGKGSLGQLLKNPELYDNLNRFAHSLAGTSEDLQKITSDLQGIIVEVRSQKGTLGKLVFSEDYAAQFTHAIQSVNLLMDSLTKVFDPIGKGEGTLGKLVHDDQLHGKISAALDKLSSAAGRMDTSLRNLVENRSIVGRALEDPELGQRFQQLILDLERGADALKKILAKVEAGEGSLGMLVQDPSIAASMRDVFLGVRENSFLTSLARRAEETGRAIRFRDERLVQKRAEEESERDLRSGEKRPEARPQPAAGPEGQGKPVPSSGPTGPPPPPPPPRPEPAPDGGSRPAPGSNR